MLAKFLPAVASLVLASAHRASERVVGPAWAELVAYDEVRVDLDTARGAFVARPARRGVDAEPVRVRLRWSLLRAPVSPAAWQLGVRTTVDDVEVDCRSGSSRTLASRAYAADGGPLASASFAATAAPWRRDAAESVGGLVVAAVCRAAGAV